MTNYHAFNEINSDTPAAIIEIGFMNLDREILTQHQDVIAKGIASGILCFVRNEGTAATQVP
jgi:N-acetylmuramoyl-L-alanine amidase